MEEVWDPTITVSDVFRNLLGHPAQIVLRWNWKSALIGAILRGSFYYTVYQASRQTLVVTLTAVLVELVFRCFDISRTEFTEEIPTFLTQES